MFTNLALVNGAPHCMVNRKLYDLGYHKPLTKPWIAMVCSANPPSLLLQPLVDSFPTMGIGCDCELTINQLHHRLQITNCSPWLIVFVASWLVGPKPTVLPTTILRTISSSWLQILTIINYRFSTRVLLSTILLLTSISYSSKYHKPQSLGSLFFAL